MHEVTTRSHPRNHCPVPNNPQRSQKCSTMLSNPQHPQKCSTMLSFFQNRILFSQQSSALTEMLHDAQQSSALTELPHIAQLLSEPTSCSQHLTRNHVNPHNPVNHYYIYGKKVKQENDVRLYDD